MEFNINAQRKTSRPYSLDTVDRLPESLFLLAKQYFTEEMVCEGVFVVPADAYQTGVIWRKMPQRALIFAPHGVLYLSESAKKSQDGAGRWISIDDILYIRLSLILLYGKLEIFGIDDSIILPIVLDYNTVGHRALSPMFHGLIRKTWEKNITDFERFPSDPTYPDFFNTSYNFFNGLQVEALQPGERVLGFVYQPEMSEPLLKKWERRIFPQTVCVITNQQIILLQQDLRYKPHHEWVFTYVPLSRIARLDLAMGDHGHVLSIGLGAKSTEQSIEVLLNPENAEKWDRISKELFGANVTIFQY